MDALGGLLKSVGMLVWFAAGVWGGVLCLRISFDVAGFWGLVAGFLLPPITALAAPVYAGFAHGNWFPLIVIYAGSTVGAALVAVGIRIDDDLGIPSLLQRSIHHRALPYE